MRVLLRMVFVLAVLGVAVGTWAGLEGHRRFTGPGPLAEDVNLVVAKGAGLETIARQLAAAGVVPDPYTFMIGARLRQVSLRAGEYAFPAHVRPIDAMTMMAEGRTVVHKLTIAEGLTVRQVLAEVEGAEYLAGTVTRKPAEGGLLPETWHLTRGDARDDVVARMEKSMRQTLDQAWNGRVAGLPLKTKEEALVLASIVERETAIASERPLVAAVFLNRLRLGMRLQSDPTVIYGVSGRLGVLDRPLTRSDLDNPHPWNTYVHDGLPPTPIANPGRASIEAVLNPAQSDALYFVADGSGGHVFARTLDDHNRNVAKWRKVEKARQGR
ncbi:endolytic transglycosylase MltG [Magnetospirillum aberrantis]|uniref:Endolytic murein transglycosylase n=1 Tax=Magnetospirillum aberrantis SpK TaxID=908842 RepID=A0A7C9UUA1_9PROT|nr:endolytic transglycosylase MltG [Magnetospirillum aberrantis]NFV80146.1 endolytic transglycosylase MltG [Magnetospirillum aberrantis SpK]